MPTVVTRTSEKVVEERIQSQSKELTGNLKGDKNMKHKRWDAGSSVSSSKSNISRAIRCRILKLPNFLALRNQQEITNPDSPSELITPQPISLTSVLQQFPPSSPKTTEDRRSFGRSPSYYGFENPSPETEILAAPRRPRRAGDVENMQPPKISVVETVQSTADQVQEESCISPLIETVSHLTGECVLRQTIDARPSRKTSFQ